MPQAETLRNAPLSVSNIRLGLRVRHSDHGAGVVSGFIQSSSSGESPAEKEVVPGCFAGTPVP